LTKNGVIWDPAKGGQVENFVYEVSTASVAEIDLEGLIEDPAEPPAAEDVPEAPAPTVPAHSVEEIRVQHEKQMAEETRRAFEAGRQQGQKAEQEAHAAQLQQLLGERRQQAEQLLAGFVAERDRYLANVEREVVRLALQIAARVLRRESQMDPLLLTGAVRVALGQLASSTTMRLKVPTPDLTLWQEAIAHLPKLQTRPEVVPDPGMHLGECVIETGLGSVDLGIRAQLAEIERGFFDRAPGSRSQGSEMADAEPGR
jgi:flagellar assembly protein FliH